MGHEWEFFLVREFLSVIRDAKHGGRDKERMEENCERIVRTLTFVADSDVFVLEFFLLF